MRRSGDDHLIAGIAGGLSRRFGVDVTLVRIVLVLAGLASGFGVAVYVLAWLVLPLEGRDANIASRALGDGRGLALSLAAVPVLVLGLVLGSALHAGYLTTVAWAGFTSAVGLLLVYRNAEDDERAFLRRAAERVTRLGSASRRSWRSLTVRVLAGLALGVGGLELLVIGHSPAAGLRPFTGALLEIGGVVVLFGPWWLRLGRDLVSERQARIRAEERADVASQVHDSVLQTLAMIQRAADNPQQVVSLARGQERELRAWLFSDRVPGSIDVDDSASFALALEQVAREVEAAHGVPVDVVAVGDCPLDDGLRAMLAAGREATTNAAKWSEAAKISIFAEVEPATVSLFVRDRGSGFDPEDVPPDRMGIAESITGRMERHGGRAVLRSAPGAGTEVELRVTRRGARP